MNKDLEKLFAQINKQFGDETIRIVGRDSNIQVRTTPTGSLTLDLALGRGGFPRGRIIEIYGPSMSGKTTICYLHIAEVQRQNEGYAAFIDAEHSFDPKLAEEYGVDLDKLVLVQPRSAENAMDTAEALARSGQFRLIVTDSVSALVPQKIAESSMEQQTMGLLARFMSTAMQKLDPVAAHYDCTMIFINQIREKIGVMYGNPETTSGGRALPFYASVRLHVRMGEQIKEKDDVIGHYVKCKVTKNKVAIPFKEAIFPLMYGKGVDRVYEIVELACLAGIIQQSGAWFRYADVTGEIVNRNGTLYKWQGKANLTQFVRDNPLFLHELEEILRGSDVQAPQGQAVDEEGYDNEDTTEETLAVEA